MKGLDKVNNDFRLTAEQKKEMVRTIQIYFAEEKQEDLGDLAANLLLDFFVKELAAVFYNKGIEDAYAYFSEKLDDVFEIQK